MQFDIALSIGDMCQTRKHLTIELRRRFGYDAGGGSFFFDWTSRDQGLVGVSRAIAEGFEFRREDFSVRRVGARLKAYNSRYGLYFTHDLKFEAKEPGPDADIQLEAGYAALAAKYLHIGQKTRDVLASNKRVLFLVCGAVTQEEAECFAGVLQNVDFKVLHLPFANKQQAGVQHPSFMISPIHFELWPGHAQSWAAALAPIELPEIRNFDAWLGRRSHQALPFHHLAAPAGQA
ncbi:MAG TPA: hypothetical protein VK968_17690 [Roseimicrobium sp.]|nr:hypothetical protein [Roseimicrobium sp.]